MDLEQIERAAKAAASAAKEYNFACETNDPHGEMVTSAAMDRAYALFNLTASPYTVLRLCRLVRAADKMMSAYRPGKFYDPIAMEDAMNEYIQERDA